MSGLIWKEWRQSGWLVIVVFVIFASMVLTETKSSITLYKDDSKYYHSAAFIKENNSYKEKSKEDYLDAKEISEALKVDLSSVSTWAVICAFLLLFVGLKITVFEKNKQMDYFTFGLPYSRNSVFLAKHLGVIVPLIIGFAAILAIRVFWLYNQIPHQDLPNIWDPISKTLWELAFYLFAVEIGIVVGIMMGEIIAACIVAIGFLGGCILFPSSFSYLLSFIQSFFTKKPISEDRYFGNEIVMFDFSKWQSYFWTALIIIFLSGLLLILGCILFKHISLENNGKFLMFPRLRPWIIVTAMLFVPIVLASFYALPTYGENDTIKATSLSEFLYVTIIFIGIGMIVGVVLWLLMYKWNTIRKAK